jgi:LDH2 family malate/lactate/ureidoglycolate dehydrogenase
VERIYLPGEIEDTKRQERVEHGIPLEAYVMQSLVELGQELGVSTSEIQA